MTDSEKYLGAMREAIKYFEDKRHLYSRDQPGLMPLRGMEKEHETVSQHIDGLKKVYQALQVEIVKQAIAVWEMGGHE